MEEHVKDLDNSEKVIVQMASDFFEDVKVVFDMVRATIMDLTARLNLIMRVVGNRTPT